MMLSKDEKETFCTSTLESNCVLWTLDFAWRHLELF